MTTITTLPDEVTKDALTASPVQSAQQKSKWLYELERAQWQAKQLPAHHERNLAKMADTETSSPDQQQQQVAKLTGNNAFESTQSTNQQIELPSTHTHTQQPNDIGVTKGPLLSGDLATSMPVTTFVQIHLTTARTPANQIMPQENALGVTSTNRKWDKLRAHIEGNETEINLWLRDTRLNNTQGIQLAMTLRKRFAEMGYRLACFTLNGRALPLDSHLTISTNS